jgi:hypothetical protein
LTPFCRFAGVAGGGIDNAAIDLGVAERRITPLTHIVSTKIHVLLHPAWETTVFFFLNNKYFFCTKIIINLI